MATHPAPPAPLFVFFLPLFCAFIPPHLAAVIHPGTKLTPSSPSAWTSPSGTFSMGFFSFLPNSYYVGIWFSSLPLNQSIVWTANRDQSVPRASALRFTMDGRLELTTNSSRQPVWAASTLFSHAVVSGASQAELLDSGNFVLRGDNTSEVVWQSFEHPTDTLLPNQKFTYSKNHSLVPWISTTNPSQSATYALVFGRTAGSVGHIRLLSRKTDEYWSQPPPTVTDLLFNTTFTMDASGTLSLLNGNGTLEWIATSCDDSIVTNNIKMLQLSVDGNLRVRVWSSVSGTWRSYWKARDIQCEVFGTCGDNSICNKFLQLIVGGGVCPIPEVPLSEICSCVDPDVRFDPDALNCVLPTSLNCSRYMMGMDGVSFGVPTLAPSITQISLQDCRDRCLNDCKCTGASSNTSACWLYNTSLYNGITTTSTAITSFIKTTRNRDGSALPSYVIPLITATASFFLVFLFLAALFKRWHRAQARRRRFKDFFLDLDELSGPKRFDLDYLHVATGGFCEQNKLGVGGFGTVYKGTCKTKDGKLEVAVKRLNHFQRHGNQNYDCENSDFTAEITTLGCVRHLNVVTLLGFCAQGPERLLVYEYVANGSLSKHIFSDSSVLSWDLRFQIAGGAAMGIEYLHAHCPMKIVHRDIKPDNILLDENFQAKVADFGVSQIMGPEITHFTNIMVCGTPTYMAPECWYAGALVTEKADAYSYGVVLLELVSGKKVTRSHYADKVAVEVIEGMGEDQDNELEKLTETKKSWSRNRALPLHYAIEVMKVGRWETLIDERLRGNFNMEDAKRLVRTVFWCLQGNPKNRPSMEDLLLMIKGHKDVHPPPIPGLFDMGIGLVFPSHPQASASMAMLPESLSQGR